MNYKIGLIHCVIFTLIFHLGLQGQLSPAITAWLQNTTLTGSYYKSGNSTAIGNGILVNCQKIQYSTDWVYVTTMGIPSYPTGPFLDGNPSQASSQNAIFKLSLNSKQNTGTPSSTTGGNIGIFINGVALFDYRDGVSWQNSSGTIKGGPIGGMGDNVWTRDAIVAEKKGFDCAKGHPAMGNYHHHQNPSAFKLDETVISTVCNLYDADGLYVIDKTNHSPLLGFAYDGFPIYGAYGYKNADGSGGVARMKSSYQLRNISTRTHYANGTDVIDGPAVNTTFPLGYFREDYEYVDHPSDSEYLDEHNGRQCVTPEYPEGTYAYFCTVDESHNSVYPYVVGPTFYGVKNASKVNAVNETTTTYIPVSTSLNETLELKLEVNIFPNPGTEFLAVQVNGLLSEDLDLFLYDNAGRLLEKASISKGSTIAFIDVQKYYNGMYTITVGKGRSAMSKIVVISRQE